MSVKGEGENMGESKIFYPVEMFVLLYFCRHTKLKPAYFLSSILLTPIFSLLFLI